MIAQAVLESLRLLSNASRLLADKAGAGVTADVERAQALAESSPSIVTPLNRVIGYEAAADDPPAAGVACARPVRGSTPVPPAFRPGGASAVLPSRGATAARSPLR